MKIAILGCGDSIWRTWGAANREQYAARIAVNCVINYFQAEYLVACDPSTITKVTGKPLKQAYSRRDLLQHCEEWPADCGFLLCDISKSGPFALSFSIESAIWLAHEKGATEIDLYGTLGDAPDETRIASAGRGIVSNRERWIDERRRVKKLIDYLSQNGTTVRSIQ